MKNKMRLIALGCAALMLFTSVRPTVTYAQEMVENTESMEETETTEVTEAVEETEATESTEATETTETTEETETTEATEATEETEVTETTEETEPTEAEEETEEEEMAVTALEDGDPQSGTSMSNDEIEVPPALLGFTRQTSAYTGLTYTHNGRYDNGYRVVNGIDVSSHNGQIDWNVVKRAGIEYAMIRVGYRTLESGGLFEDSNFRTNIDGALKAGLKVGVYMFSQAITKQEAAEEANFALARVKGYNITLPIVIDYEYGKNHTGRLANANLNIDFATAVVNEFCTTVQANGYAPMIYANKSMLQTGIRGSVLDDYYKIWLAHYTTGSDYNDIYYAWQYSSKGSVSGISGNVDCDFFYETYNLEGAKNYVTSLYVNLLGRNPDQGGLNGFAGGLANGTATAASVAQEIVNCPEFKNHQYSYNTYVTRLYRALLGREAGSSEVTYWANFMTNGVSETFILQQIAGSQEFAVKCNSYGITRGTVTVTENRDKNYNVTAYVMRCYQKILGRNADVSGLNTWSGEILRGANGAGIVKDLVYSDEFKRKNVSNGDFVDIMYRAMLGREADPSGKQHWQGFLDEGMTYISTINGFAVSNEFQNICKQYGITAGSVPLTEARDVNYLVTAFVNRNYKYALNRNGEPGGLNNWCTAILSKALSPKSVAYGFVFSAESNGKNRNNEEFVEMLYNLCLGRSSDPAGKQNWLSNLSNGASRENVFWGFANSPEFEGIIASYGL